ncbi:MAG: 16S rRNA (uracil(1498)-N(3))-methyltransferase [Acidimicrobiia bacterium]
MRHTPHLVIAAPWEGETLPLSVLQWRHLNKVLRLNRGERVSYTDGLGTVGSGRLGSQIVERGDEEAILRPAELTMAVAPPDNKDRQRFLVEKLAEIGVTRLQWMRTQHGQGRPASGPKVFSWALGAVEQSRGAWLMETGPEMVGWGDLDGEVVVCDATGGAVTPKSGTVVIGPEGGWADGEIPPGLLRWSLGSNVLRVETAAVVAAARILSL